MALLCSMVNFILSTNLDQFQAEKACAKLISKFSIFIKPFFSVIFNFCFFKIFPNFSLHSAVQFLKFLTLYFISVLSVSASTMSLSKLSDSFATPSSICFSIFLHWSNHNITRNSRKVKSQLEWTMWGLRCTPHSPLSLSAFSALSTRFDCLSPSLSLSFSLFNH